MVGCRGIMGARVIWEVEVGVGMGIRMISLMMVVVGGVRGGLGGELGLRKDCFEQMGREGYDALLGGYLDGHRNDA